MTRSLTDRETATILHALRDLQDDMHNGNDDFDGCDHFEECIPLTEVEIDTLCESICLDSLTIKA